MHRSRSLVASVVAIGLVPYVSSVSPPAERGDAISVVSSIDGRLEVFVQIENPSGGVYHSWQLQGPGTAPNVAKWSAWERFLPVPDPASDVAAARTRNGQLVVGWISGGALWINAQSSPNGGFAGPRRLDSHDLHDLSVVSNADGRLEFFALSANGAAWSVAQIFPGAADWGNHNLQGHDLASISAAAYSDGRLGLVAMGGDGHVYWTTQYAPGGDWLDWTGLQGENITAVVGGSNADGRFDVVALGGDGNLWERCQNERVTEGYGTWAPWKVIAQGPFHGPLRMVANQDGRLEVFALNQDNTPYHTWQSGANGSWNATAVPMPLGRENALAVTSLMDGRLAVAAANTYVVQGVHKGFISIATQTSPNGGWQAWLLGNEPAPLFPDIPAVNIASFTASPDYVNQGATSRLNWTLSTSGGCTLVDLRIARKIYGEPEVPVYEEPHPATTGHFDVTPAGATFVYYTLYVSCQGAAPSSKQTSVQLAPTPPAPTASLVLTGPFLAPNVLHEKQPFTATYWFQNVGGAASQSGDFQLFIDDTPEPGSMTLPALAPGGAKSLSWSVTRQLTGYFHAFSLRQGATEVSSSQVTVEP